jgi:hypothetical protein
MRFLLIKSTDICVKSVDNMYIEIHVQVIYIMARKFKCYGRCQHGNHRKVEP